MKKTIFTLVTLAFIGLSNAYSQVGIGTTDPDDSAKLELQSTEKGFLPPRMDNAQRDAITNPAEGLTIYNTENNCLEFWNDTFWVSACDGAAQPGPIADCATPGFIPPYLTADETTVNEVTSPTGRQWMDRNLGAFTADRSTPGPAGGIDCWAYGNLYQWGRTNDGHEDRTSNTTAGPVAAGAEGSDFITVGSSPFDWLFTPDDDRWGDPTDADKGVHDPCPTGYRVPTEAELNNERLSWSSNDREGAISSPLKLPLASIRSVTTGGLINVGTRGDYWSSTVSGSDARRLNISGNAGMGTSGRANGLSVRCLKD